MGKSLALSLLWGILSLPSYADELKEVSFGEIISKFEAPVHTVLAEQTVVLALNECFGERCKNYRIRWESIGNTISSSPGTKKFLFSSGVSGIGIEADTSMFNLFDRQEIVFRVLKLGIKNGSGSFYNGQPLLKWYLETLQNGSWDVVQTGVLRVDGSLHAGTCSPIQGDLHFDMMPVSINMLKELRIGEKLHNFASHQSIPVKCSPGVADMFSIRFSGEHYQGAPWILKAGNNVGFIAEVTTSEKRIMWNSSESYDGAIPESGIVDIPITVYYTKAGNDIGSGEIQAHGTFTISYR
ncbi:hypothetical protein G9Z29_004417 [Salmonella enterica]|nr:hypothetical protein [Salmonella enterica]EEK3802784.1 hypothetical protein [Salmonella enterica]EEP9213598.1 hypothetical protein [Salmonella enterica]